MRAIVLTAAAIVLSSTFALAQKTPAQLPPAPVDVPVIVSPETKSGVRPIPGENSFTEAQAQKRMVEAGYFDISRLKLDANGVWWGTATKGGHKVNVGVDFLGNVVQQ